MLIDPDAQAKPAAFSKKNRPRSRALWWRAYAGLPLHPLWKVVARRSRQPVTVVLAVVITLLDHASGVSDPGDVSAFDVELSAAALDLEETAVAEVFAALEAKGWISHGRISTWDDRQVSADDPNAAERKRRSRARKAEENDEFEDNRDKVTAGHGDVTACHGREEKNREEKIRAEKEGNLKEAREPALPSEKAPSASSGPKKATRLSEDWSPSELDRAYAKKLGMSDRDIDRQAESIRNWSASSTNGMKLDWAAAWRNWASRAAEGAPKAVITDPLLAPKSANYTQMDLVRANGDPILAARLKTGRAF